ncbi:MAG: ral nucleoside transport system permease protein [Chloroflexota bacterium]|nr:ral nucleoside transport system permease protein [Chloroflexota bacterium]
MRHRISRTVGILALPVISVVLSVVVGSAVIIVSEWLVAGQLKPELAFKAYGALLNGSIGSYNAIVNTLVQTVPLLLGGLSVGLAFKAGLFNIGAQGQFLMGALGSVIVGVQLADAPGIIAIPASLAAGMLAGAAWGFIPGVLKATRGAHEVVTTIMLNFVAISFLAFMVSGPLSVVGTPSPITFDVGNGSLPIILGRNGHLGILIAPVFAVLYWFLLFRTTRGFEIRVAGASPDAARYAGMSPRRLITWTMTIAGMVAGLAGSIELLGTTHYMTASYDTTVGFDAIAVALLGRTSPIGIVLSALLFGAMRTGASAMQIQAQVPAELVGVLQATILFFLVASPVIKRLFRIRGASTGLEDAGTFTSTYGGEARVG